MESIDVYCFGHFLYEITFGNPLDVAHVGNLPENCPPIIQPILHSILSTSAVKTGLPTMQDLLSNPLFADVPITMNEKPVFRIGKVRDALHQAREAIESRLKEDQKRLRQFNRLSKARSELMSEEEKKKRKKTAKKKANAAPTKSNTIKEQTTPPAQQQKQLSTPAAVAPPPPPPPVAASASKAAKTQLPAAKNKPERGALLSSISGFSKNGLKKSATNDRSAPRV